MVNIMKYDYVIVGAGLFGSIFARQLTDSGFKCLVIEKRNHIAGNCYTKNIKGVNVHMYGSHVFHTSDLKVWDYVNKFIEFNSFVNCVKANCSGEIYSLPINLNTLNKIWGVNTPEKAKAKLKEVCKPNDECDNAEDWLLSHVGKEITELFYRGYTEKHWNKPLRELPSSIYKRLPIRTNFNENYYDHIYQGIPIGGYTKMFEEILKGIDVRLETDFLKDRGMWETMSSKIVYTGPIDEFFNYKYGELEYKTIDIKFEIMNIDDYQGCAVMSHPQHNVKYTKSVEHKHFEKNDLKGETIVTYEYPVLWDRNKCPYYPLEDQQNIIIFNKYKEEARANNKYIFGGRLADYKYYDMHHVVKSALDKSRKEIV